MSGVEKKVIAEFGLEKKHVLKDVDLTGKKVFMRVDFNVPLKDGLVADKTRIVGTIPTIKYILEKGCSLVLCSHLGRPDGRKLLEFTLKPVAEELGKLLGLSVIFVDDCVGEEAVKVCGSLKPGQVVLLENLRFYPEEEGSGKDAEGKKVVPSKEEIAKFRATLTSFGEVFVNDAFGAAHRAHSSIVGIDLPVRAAGLLMEKEMTYFRYVLENPVRPFVAIMGGAKVKDKIQIIDKMLDRVDGLIIGGGMAFTFLKVLHDMKIGKSLFDTEGSLIVKDLYEKAQKNGVTIHLPVDFITADSFSATANTGTCTVEEGISDDLLGLDIGPKTCEKYAQVLSTAKLVLCNGPMGVFEFEAFGKGTKAIFESLDKYTKESGMISVVAGGDSVAACNKFGFEGSVSHVSTGGGAALELLEGKFLPGLKILSDK